MTFTTEIDRHPRPDARAHAEVRVGGVSPRLVVSVAGVSRARTVRVVDGWRSLPGSRERATAWAGFVAASIAVHGAAAVALGARGGSSRGLDPRVDIVELAVVAPPVEPPSTAEVAAPTRPEPAPPDVPPPSRPPSGRTVQRTGRERPRVGDASASPSPQAAHGGAPPAVAPVEPPAGASAADHGGDVAVAVHGGAGQGPLGPGGAGGDGSVRTGAGSTGESRSGVVAEGTAPAAPRVDRRALARAWMEEVSRILLERARRNYPRSALRLGREGTVLLAITVDPSGRIGAVHVETPSGVEALDASAVETVYEVGSVPPPPAALAWQTRALRMPIVYRIR